MQAIPCISDESIVIQTAEGYEIRMNIHSFNVNQIKVSSDVSKEQMIAREE